MRLEGQVAVVTGGTGALGTAVASAFVSAGARVVATSHGPVRHQPQEALALEQVDLADERSALDLADRVRDRYGRLDALVHCVGRYEAGTRVADASLDLWRRQLDANATSAFMACRAFVPLLLAARRGSVVLVASRAAVRPYAGAAPHAAAKAAVVSLAETLALEVRDRGVTVNCVLPSVIDTPANRASMPDADSARWVTPEEVATTILWLCSPEAREVTGAVLPVYGRA